MKNDTSVKSVSLTQNSDDTGNPPVQLKTLDNTAITEVKQKVPDVKVVGNGDLFKVLCKASSTAEGWMKSTKAMEIDQVGVVLQVTTQQGNNVAEALVFVPNVKVVSDVNGGRKLVHSADKV